MENLKRLLIKAASQNSDDDDKDVDEAVRHPDVPGAGAKKRKKLKNKQDKVAAVMKEFKRGTLRSGSGKIVTDRNQAIAIAMSEAGLSKGRIPGIERMLKGLRYND